MKTTRRKKLKNHHRITPVPGNALHASLLKYPQAADRLGVNVRTLKQWVSEGKVDVVRFAPHCVRFTLDALDRFTAENTREAR